MKKFLVVLLSLGLIVAFSAMASAADATIKMGGAYYLQGNYWNNPTAAGDDSNYSRAYIHQRARVQTDLGVVEGLSFRFRFDAMEKKWGQTDWKNNYEDQTGQQKADHRGRKPQDPGSHRTGPDHDVRQDRRRPVPDRLSDRGPVGYSISAAAERRVPGFLWTMPMGNFTFGALYEKFFEGDFSQVKTYPQTGYQTDSDWNSYAIFGVFKYTGGDAGLLLKYYDDRSHRGDTVATAPGQGGYKRNFYQVAPYGRVAFGPVYLEGEFTFVGGDVLQWEKAGAVPDKSVSGWGAYLMAKFTMGPAAFGLAWANSTGDNGKDASKSNENPFGAGTDYNPALILMGDTLCGQSDNGTANTTCSPANVTNRKLNMMLVNAFGSFKATPKLDFGASFTWAKVNEKRTALEDDLGMEFDVTATYKIYDNLTYKVGAGYLWTGDYFKGASATKTIGNDYLLMNNLTLIVF